MIKGGTSFFLVLIILAGAGGYFWWNREGVRQDNGTGTPEEIKVTEISREEKRDQLLNSVTPGKLDAAVNSFDVTSGVIKELVSELNRNFGDSLKIVQTLRENLDPDNLLNLQYSSAILGKESNEEQLRKAREKWAIAILGYQQQNFAFTPDGVVEPNGQTYEKLKSSIEQQLEIENAANYASTILPADKLNLAIANFKGTRKVLKNMGNDLVWELPNEAEKGTPAFAQTYRQNRLQVIEAMKRTLAEDTSLNLDFGGAIGETLKEEPSEFRQAKLAWMEAIYLYQLRKQQEVPIITTGGYLITSGATNYPLQQDIRENLGLNYVP